MHCGYIHYHVNPLSSDEAWQWQWHFLILQASDWVLHQIWPCEWGCSPFQSTGQDTWIHVLSVQWGPWSREWPAFSLSPSSLFRRYVPHWSQLEPCMFFSIAGDEARAMCSWVCGIQMWCEYLSICLVQEERHSCWRLWKPWSGTTNQFPKGQCW